MRENILDFDPTVSQGEKLSIYRQKMMEKKKKEEEERNLKNKTAERNLNKSESVQKKEGALVILRPKIYIIIINSLEFNFKVS